MSRTYGVAFSNSDPRLYPSLAPTFLAFNKMSDGSAISPPAISQLLIPGVSTTGVYQFNYTASFAVYFLLDGITTTTASERYVYGILDPIQAVDVQLAEYSATFTAANSTLVAIGTSNIALGTTNVALGTTNVAIGTTAVSYGVLNLALGTSIYATTTTLIAIGTTLTALDTKIGSTASSFGTSAADPVDLYGYLKRIQEFLEGDATFTKLSGAWDVKSRGGSLLASKTLVNTSSAVTKD